MARQPRVQVPGAPYHVTARGALRQRIVRDDFDRTAFLATLPDVLERHDWSCHAFCLMETHFHLVVRTAEADLARGMQRLHACYAQGFNIRHDQTRHVLERRYHSVLIADERHVLELCRYLALNPVEAGLCARPGEWPWSSYAAMLGLAPRPPFLAVEWLLTFFGGEPARARARLQAFVEGADARRPVSVS